ncbi:hypothetical protein [Reichenbachiella sp.]|uniref:hypothetical protein n=1 Tax=Reichenbachiella sp. TaxID=2184521 RepID=UPI003BAE8489
MNNKKPTKEQLIPFQWFWTDQFGDKMSFLGWLNSRKFSIIYLIVIWSIVSILGFASTWDCDTWQKIFACDRAIWLGKMLTDPVDYVLSWFTTPFFHNGIDHILFVSIFGIMMPVQSFEVQYGTRPTFIIFFVSYIIIGIFFGSFFNLGLSIWPDSHFFSFAFARNWMGGSVGFYAFFGALSYLSRKQWILPLCVACFEIFNLTVIGIDIHISFIHTIAVTGGFFTCLILKRKGILVAN